MLIKTALADLVGMLHPREVRRVQMDGKRVDEGTTKAVYGFAALYVLVILTAGLIVSLDGYDFHNELHGGALVHVEYRAGAFAHRTDGELRDIFPVFKGGADRRDAAGAA